jgi:hypothetical protein
VDFVVLALGSEITVDASFWISRVEKLQYNFGIREDIVDVSDILFDEVILRFRQVGTFVLQVDQAVFVLVEDIHLDLFGLREGFLVLVQELLLEGEHVGEELILFGLPVGEPLALHLAGLSPHPLVVLLDPPLDLVLYFEGSALGRTALGLIGIFHHGKYIIFNNRIDQLSLVYPLLHPAPIAVADRLGYYLQHLHGLQCLGV